MGAFEAFIQILICFLLYMSWIHTASWVRNDFTVYDQVNLSHLYT